MSKKHLAGLVAVIFGASLLCGCSSPAPQQDSQISTTVEPTPAAPDYEAQIKLLAERSEEWNQDDGVLPYYYHQYTVTDLDWNGRLEILAMSTQGTGIFTYGTIYQVCQDLTGLELCTYLGDDGCSLPEMIMDFVPAGYNPDSGTYHYVFKDDFRAGAAEYGQVIMPLYLKDGVATFQILGRMHAQVTDGVTQEEYYRAKAPFVAQKGDVLTKDFLRNYQPITPEAYENLIPEYLTTLQDFTANFEWFQVEGSVDTATLTKSWEVFRSSLG